MDPPRPPGTLPTYELPLDVDLIERVEIIRGPGSSLYGSNAVLGVINVITRRGESVGGVELEGHYGSFDSRQGRFTWGGKLERGPDLIVSGTIFDSAGNDQFYPGLGATSGTDYEHDYDLFASLAFEQVTFQALVGSREKGIPTGSYETVFDDPRNRTVDAYNNLAVTYASPLEGPWELSTRLFYNDYSYRGWYVYDYDGPPFVVNNDLAWGEEWGGEAQLTSTGLERQRITVGAELREVARVDQQNYDEDAVYLDDQRSSTIWGLFAQDEIELGERLTLSLGLRHDDYFTFGGTTNPRLALIYRPDERTAWKLLAGRAFRAPNAYELYYHDGGETAKANPELEPETIETLELVWERDVTANVRSSLSVFHYDLHDLIAQIEDPADELLVFVNSGDVAADGIELELEGRCENGVRGRASHTFQNVQYTDTGARLENSPQHLSKLGLSFPLFDRRLLAGLELQYIGPRDLSAGGTLDEALVTNFTLLRESLWDGVDVSLSAFNLLDEDYSDPGGGEHTQDRIGQDGRTLVLQLTASF